jgi:AcrR family transcriptional regulator
MNYDAGELTLILAAERLFARNGLAGVSLRQVNQEAGHRNMSAAHYHFGSREGLVLAVLQHRMRAVDARRAELLARPVTPGREPDLRFYIEAYVLPLAEQLRPRPEGNYYLRFLAQLRHLPPDLEALQRLTPAAFAMSRGMGDLVAYLPAAIIEARQGAARTMIVAALAEVEEQLGRGALDQASVKLVCANLIDMVAAAFTAPLSAETLAGLREGPR